MDNFKRKYPEDANDRGTITYVKNLEEALEGANACFVFTKWIEIKAVEPDVY